MIVCCGEALIDMVPKTSENGPNSYQPIAGGALFNTAISLGRLEEDVGFLAGISRDQFGEIIIQALEDSNVDTGFCLRSYHMTTLAFVELKNGNASYRFYDENSAMRMIDKNDVPPISTSVDALHFGGISLISEPCGTVYESILMRNSFTSVISLDPNIRPNFISNKTKYKARLERMIKRSDIIKVSDEDLEWIADGGKTENLIHTWLNENVKVVVVTRGANGLTAFTKDYKIDKDSLKVEVVDTIGAGDTFNAGFLSCLKRTECLSKQGLQSLDEQTLDRCLSFANEVAARTVAKAGANPPWSWDIDNRTKI